MALILANLGGDLTQLGRYEEAEPMLRRSLAIRERVMGADHPAVAEPLLKLAELLRRTGRDAEAEPLERRARRIAP